MNQQKELHLVFSLLMGAMMIFLVTFVITAINIGFSLAPVARTRTAGLVGAPQ